MLKVSLLIDCDSCRSLYPFSRFVSDDVSAWRVHGEALVDMSDQDGWDRSECGNFHYCPACSASVQEMGDLCS